MLNWFRQWRINRLLIEVKRDEAIQKAIAKFDEIDDGLEGRMAANKERLRQLGFTGYEPIRLALPTNYVGMMNKMLSESEKVRGDDNG